MLVHKLPLRKRKLIMSLTFIMVLILSACVAPVASPAADVAPAEELSTEEANIALVEQFQLGIFQDGNLDLIDELTSDDFVYQDFEPGEVSRAAMRQESGPDMEQFGPVNVELHDIFAEGDLVVGRWSVSGAGEQEFTLKGITINRVEEGKIASELTVADELGLLMQLGVIPPMGGEMPMAETGEVATTSVELDDAQIEANRQAAIRITEELWGGGDTALIEKYYAPDFVAHNPEFGAAPDTAGVQSSVEMMHGVFSDLSATVEELVVADDKVATLYRVNGVHTGDGIGIPPSNRPVDFLGITIARFNEDGKVVEEWGATDLLGMMSQIGAVPPTAASVPGDFNTVTFTAQDYSFDGPESIPAGWTRVEMVNMGGELHHMQLIRLEDGKMMDDLMGELMASPEHPPEWVSFSGGPSVVVPGEGSSALVNLEPGNYVAICLLPDAEGVPHIAHGMIRPFTVTEETADTTAPPEADITMELNDFSFTLSDTITPGRHTFKVMNNGLQPHEVALVWLAPGASIGDFLAAVENPTDAPPPGKPLGGLQVIDVGAEGYFAADFLPGEYGLVCFHPDKDSGAPHVALGMVQQFTVE